MITLSEETTYQKAVKRLREQLQAEPQNARIHMELATLLMVEGEMEAAVDTARKAVALVPEDASVRLRLCSILVEAELYDEALEVTTEIKSLKSNSPLLQRVQLEASLLERELQKGYLPLADLKAKIIGRVPDVNILNEIGCYELLIGRIERASSAFLRALSLEASSLTSALNFGFLQGLAALNAGGVRHSSRELMEASKRHPDEPRLMLHLAEAFEASSMFSASIQSVQSALKVSATCIEVYDMAARYALLDSANASLLEDLITKIYEDARAAFDADKDSNELRLKFGVVLVGVARFEMTSGRQGSEYFEEAKEVLSPLAKTELEANLRLAECLDRLGETKASEEILETAAKLWPDSERIAYEMGAHSLRVGELDSAIEHFLVARTLAPTDAAIYQSLRYTFASSCRLQTAELEYNLATTKDKLDSNAALVYSRTLIEVGRVDSALELLQKVASANPSADIMAELGRAQARLKEYDEAKESFNKAIELDEKCAVAHRGLGEILMQNPLTIAEGIAELDLFRKYRD